MTVTATVRGDAAAAERVSRAARVTLMFLSADPLMSRVESLLMSRVVAGSLWPYRLRKNFKLCKHTPTKQHNAPRQGVTGFQILSKRLSTVDTPC
jgi:hypothetical protein